MMPGRFKGKIAGCDSGAVGANNAPMAKLFFKLEGETGLYPHTMWFSDKVNEKTGKTYTELVVEKLIEHGFRGKCVSEMSDEKIDVSDLFDTEKEWDIEIDYQVGKDGQITKYFEAKWVNDPEKSGTSKLDHAKAVSVFKGMGLGGMIAQKRGAVKKTETAPGTTENFAADEIPF